MSEMQRRRILSSASGLTLAAGLLCGAAVARADDGVTIDQEGDSHTATITQTSGVGNEAGDDQHTMEQKGIDNLLVITQTGSNNRIGTAGQGVVQSGTASGDGSAANSATLIQDSDGNFIGQLIQTSAPAHAITSNVLSVTQQGGDFNTVASVSQVQGEHSSANDAIVNETGSDNWIDSIAQQTSTGDGDNHLEVDISGNQNGINAELNGPGALNVLALSSGAAAGRVVQGPGATGGADNSLQLAITGNYNQFGVSQFGVDNQMGPVTISGTDNSFGTYQDGRHNQISAGGISGDGNDVGIRQTGDENIATLVLSPSSGNDSIGIGQDGRLNRATELVDGNDDVVGISQSGAYHRATLTITGDNNLVLGIQANGGANASVGNTLDLVVNGDDNNTQPGSTPPAFSGPAAIVAKDANPVIDSTPLIAPDASLLIAPYSGTLLLAPGVLVQWGDNNSMTINVGPSSPSSSNLFAAVQKGNGNTMSSSIQGRGNQFVALQLSNGNNATVVENGGGNSVGIEQQ